MTRKSEKASNATLHKDLQRTNKLLAKYVSHHQAFIRGIFSGLGGILGATIVLAILLWLLSQLEVVPIIGEFASQVIKVVQEKSGATPISK